MPGLATGISLGLPSFLFPSSPHLCLQWACSLRLTRKPDGFEAPPIFIPWRHKMAYKFIVDGRWMTNNAEPTEVDHGFINNIYTAPPKPPAPAVLPEPVPEPSTAPPSYHSESEVEHEPAAEKVSADDKLAVPVDVDVIRDTPTPTAAPEQQHPRVPDNEPAVEAVRESVTAPAAAVVEATQAAVAQVAPAPADVDKAANEVRTYRRSLFTHALTNDMNADYVRVWSRPCRPSPRGTFFFFLLRHNLTTLWLPNNAFVYYSRSPKSRTLSTSRSVQRTFHCVLLRVRPLRLQSQSQYRRSKRFHTPRSKNRRRLYPCWSKRRNQRNLRPSWSKRKTQRRLHTFWSKRKNQKRPHMFSLKRKNRRRLHT